MHKNGFYCLGKVFFVLSLLLAVPVLGVAGPFGFEMGMSKKDFVKVYGLDKDNNIIKIPNPNPFFVSYTPSFSKNSGLCRIIAFTDIIETNIYGDAVKKKFDSIERALNTKYGSFLKVDRLSDGSIWDEGKDWTISLSKKERTLSDFWDKEEGSNLSDNLEAIILQVHGLGQTSAFISLKYNFNNIEECREENRQNNEQGL